MRIFVGEFICGGGLARRQSNPPPSSLVQEGGAMLRAIVADLSEVAEVVVPVDPRIAPSLADHCTSVDIDPKRPLWGQWVAAAQDCDSALIVAPESNGVLAKGVAMLRAGGVDVMAGSGDFLRVASDKLQTAKVLVNAGIAHPLYLAEGDRRFKRQLQSCDRFVLKPRDGCGTREIRPFDSFDEARNELTEDLILQNWVDGRAISISLIASGARQTFLPAVQQVIDDQTYQYAGGRGPLEEEDQRRAAALASRAIAAMPPTARGFVGLDLLLGDRPSEDYVIEINPRLTTSYVGLRKMIHGNLAARLFDFEGGPVACNTAADSVRWTPDGQVWINDAVAGSA